MLDLWLMVAVFVWIFDSALAAVLNHARFDLGWYAGRVYGLLASSFGLAALLLENGRLYALLAEAHADERRERRRPRNGPPSWLRSTRSWRASATRCRTTCGRRCARSMGSR